MYYVQLFFFKIVLQLEEAAKEVVDEVTRPRPVGEETVQDIQVMLKTDAHHASIRSLKVFVYFTDVVHAWSPLIICCHFQLTVRSSVPPGEGAWHNHLGHGGESKGH